MDNHMSKSLLYFLGCCPRRADTKWATFVGPYFRGTGEKWWKPRVSRLQPRLPTLELPIPTSTLTIGNEGAALVVQEFILTQVDSFPRSACTRIGDSIFARPKI